MACRSAVVHDIGPRALLARDPKCRERRTNTVIAPISTCVWLLPRVASLTAFATRVHDCTGLALLAHNAKRRCGRPSTGITARAPCIRLRAWSTHYTCRLFFIRNLAVPSSAIVAHGPRPRPACSTPDTVVRMDAIHSVRTGVRWVAFEWSRAVHIFPRLHKRNHFIRCNTDFTQ